MGFLPGPFKRISRGHSKGFRRISAVSEPTERSCVEHHGVRLGGVGLGTYRKKIADYANLRSSIQSRSSGRPTAGHRCVGARLLSSVPKSEDGVFRDRLAPVELGGCFCALRLRTTAQSG